MNIDGYEIDGELKNDNSGYSRWGFAVKGGREYFIKEFLTPIYPVDETVISAKQLEQKRKICTEFYQKKRKFYDVLDKCSTGNIVVVRDFFRNGSRYYIVTEKIYASPIDPSDVAAMNDEQKKLIMRVILHCIKALHEHHIVHGDIKPDNILLKRTEKGMYTAKIIDFDSSFLEEDPPHEDDIQGDMIYLAPESFLAIAGEECKLTRKIDVFALGILFHQYLCGKTPGFDESKYDYTFEAVLDGGEIRIDRKLDKKLADLIKRMLDKDPDKRPSVTQVFKELTDKPEPPHKEPSSTVSESRLKIRMGKNSSGIGTSEKSTAEIITNPDKTEPPEKPKSFFKPAGDL